MTLKQKIHQLRAEGKSYSQIVEQLKCSKGTVAYHCNSNVKHNQNLRQQNWRNENTLKVKIRNFNHPNQYKRETYGNVRNPLLTEDALIEKFGTHPHCYITDEPIDLNNPEEYSLDHIIPISKGGTNDISNCGLASKKANMLKNDLTYNELLTLCQTVLNHYKENGGPSPQSSGEPSVYETGALTKG